MTIFSVFELVLLMVVFYEVHNLVEGFLKKQTLTRTLCDSLIARDVARMGFMHRVLQGHRHPVRPVQMYSLCAGMLLAVPLSVIYSVPATVALGAGLAFTLTTYASAHAYLMAHSKSYRAVEQAVTQLIASS